MVGVLLLLLVLLELIWWLAGLATVGAVSTLFAILFLLTLLAILIILIKKLRLAWLWFFIAGVIFYLIGSSDTTAWSHVYGWLLTIAAICFVIAVVAGASSKPPEFEHQH